MTTRAVLRSPKKPHSGKRATVKFNLMGQKWKKNYCYINGIGGRTVCNAKYESFLFAGGRRRDIPALKYTAVRGYRGRGGGALGGIAGYRNARSKFGTKFRHAGGVIDGGPTHYEESIRVGD
jgi:ribosomal protein S12